MIKRIALLIAIVLLLIPGSIVMASDITDAGYAGIIRVSNNSTETQNVAVPVTGVNSTNLINAGFLASNASDCTIRQSGSDIPFMPGYGVNPWCLWVTDIATSTYYSDVLYTPNVTGGKIVFFPDPSSDGLTIPYDPSLALGNEFEIRINNVLPDTTHGVDKNIIYVENSLRVYDSTTTDGTVTAYLYGAAPANNNITPNGAGSETSIPYVTSGAHWQAVSVWSSDNYVYNDTTTYTRDLYAMSNPTVPEALRGNINSVTLYFLTFYSGLNSASLKPSIKTNGTVYDADGLTIYSEPSTTKSKIFTTNPVTGNAWTWDDVDNLEAGQSIKSGYAGQSVHVYGFYATINYSIPSCTISLSDVSFDEKTSIVLSANTTHLTFSMGESTNTVELNGSIFLDNSNDLVFFQNGSVLYAENMTVSVGGTPVSAWKWEYGDTFHDLIGDNDATPSFRTVSSDADVSAELIEFLPISESTAPAYSVTEAEPFLTTTPTISSDFTTDSSNSTLPGSEVISETATAGGTPVSLPFTILGCFGLLTVSFTASYLTKKSGSASIWPKMLCVGIAAGLLVGVKVFDFWMITYLLMMIVAFSMAKTHATWGGEAGYNVVGFLAMSFVGMTIINRVMEGVFINSTDVGILNNVLVFRPVNVFGLFQISVPNLDFLSTGIPHLIRWDYSFFGGNAVIIQYMFYSITAFVAFLLFVLMLGVVFNMLSRNR